MNLLNLLVKIGVKDEASDNVEKLSGKLKNGLATAAKVGAAAVTAAATGFAFLTKEAISSYADYEQLAGGAKLMFGDAYDYIAEKAMNAFKTVQMSQNDYLQQVNGFATGLKTALGGNEQAAAELADRIINAEADVVAATGNSQEAVQNAFNGIMKSNYTMLDNLQIGITPTKEGFQEVIDKVNEWNAANGRATTYQIENLADCQSALVDYIEMVGMQGYAANEAADTIQGSVAAMKGAWQNLLTGIADENADFETLTINMVDSLILVGENIIPRVSSILGGVSQLVSAASANVIPLAVTTIFDNLPMLLEAAVGMVKALATGILDSLPTITQAAIDIVFVILNELTSEDFLTQLIEAAILLIATLSNGLVDAIPRLVAQVPVIIENLIGALMNNLPNLMAMGVDLLLALIVGIVQTIPELINQMPRIIYAIADTLANYDWGGIGRNIVQGLKNGIASMWENLKNWFKQGVDDLVGGVKRLLGIHSPSKVFAGIGENMALGLGEGWEDEIDSVKSGIDGTLDFTAGNVSNSSTYVGSGGNEAILALLLEYLPALANMRVVLQSGELVGLLAPGMDEELAKISTKRSRAV